MSIDWITVIAQIANFLVLVWLLKRFLYRPILDGIDAREAEIALHMATAGKAQKEAETAEAQYRAQQAQLHADRDTLVDKALQASEAQRDSLLAEARAKLEQEQQDWRKHLQREREQFTARLQRAASETLLELTRKALRELADETLEAAIVRNVGTRLYAIADELTQAAGDTTAALASTRDALPENAQAELQAEIKKLLPHTVLRFETNPQQAPGLILRVGGAQVAWTVDSYTEEFDTLLNDRMGAGASGRMRSSGG